MSKIATLATVCHVEWKRWRQFLKFQRAVLVDSSTCLRWYSWWSNFPKIIPGSGAISRWRAVRSQIAQLLGRRNCSSL